MLTKTLGQGKFYEKLHHDTKRMWSIYVRVMNSLVTNFADSDLPAVKYLLEEDMETLGFVPFQTPQVMHRFLGSDMVRKPARHTGKRLDQREEMLARIRDLVSDAMKLSKQQVGNKSTRLDSVYPTNTITGLSIRDPKRRRETAYLQVLACPEVRQNTCRIFFEHSFSFSYELSHEVSWVQKRSFPELNTSSLRSGFRCSF